MARVTAAQKKTVTEPKVEASLEKKVVEQPVKKTTRTAAPKKVERPEEEVKATNEAHLYGKIEL